ncbi:MAG TPA: hypothetical protein VLL52_02335 [Anaerolineae bacterium]|nr:hypothetical protein [Anaerolineae bacterium]
MFQQQDYFADLPQQDVGQVAAVMGKIAAGGLHAAKVTFLVYSGYHGISATLSYAGGSELARLAQIVGIVTLELTLLSLYISWHTQRITGAAQSVAAGITYAIGFTLACLGIIADSQLHAGIPLSGWLTAYLRWGLPLAPALMALGALFTHELNPHQLRARREASAKLQHEQDKFEAYMATQRAQMDIQKSIANMQLNAQLSAANQIATWYGSDEAQQAITSHALSNAPSLLRSIGIDTKHNALASASPNHQQNPTTPPPFKTHPASKLNQTPITPIIMTPTPPTSMTNGHQANGTPPTLNGIHSTNGTNGPNSPKAPRGGA